MKHAISGGTAIVLMPLTASLIDSYCAMFSPTIAQALHTDVDAERVYIEQQCKQRNGLFYCIVSCAAQTIMGAIAIGHNGALYSWLNEAYWGQGYYQQALVMLAGIYFAQTESRYFSAYVDVENKRSYYALTKCGFAPYAIRRGPFGKQHHLILRRK